MDFRNAIPYIVGGAILVGGAFVVLTGRSQKLCEQGQDFERKGALSDAIERYEWAIQAYSPFGPYPARALERLQGIAQDAEVNGATGTAIEASQAVVSGLAVIENVRQPYEEELREAKERLDRLNGALNETPTGNTP